MVPPAKKLEDLIHLAELCVDLLQQNEEHYAEVIPQSPHLNLPKSRPMYTTVSLSLTILIRKIRAPLYLHYLISMRASGYWYTIKYYVSYRRTMSINLPGNL